MAMRLPFVYRPLLRYRADPQAFPFRCSRKEICTSNSHNTVYKSAVAEKAGGCASSSKINSQNRGRFNHQIQLRRTENDGCTAVNRDPTRPEHTEQKQMGVQRHGWKAAAEENNTLLRLSFAWSLHPWKTSTPNQACQIALNPQNIDCVIFYTLTPTQPGLQRKLLTTQMPTSNTSVGGSSTAPALTKSDQ